MREFCTTLTVLAGCALVAVAQESVDYLTHIKPVLKLRCYACHGALKQKAGLRLDTGSAIRQGSEHGPVVQTNDVEKSRILARIASKELDERMPPEGEPLTADQIASLRRWIAQGAPSPPDERPDSDPREHWAFRIPMRPPLPRVSNLKSESSLPRIKVRNPIDAWIVVEHERRGLTPQTEASKPILLRRVYLDLLGLPPTREQLRDFLGDPRPDAYERVVDQLLNSPQYGERWARHWMDLWRYSDWYGRRHVPDVWNSAPQIWRWRDWIIRSLNTDKGYDRMLMEMLAADEVAPLDEEAAVATGFLVRNWYALNPHQWMRDNVEHTAKAFLGLTFNCAHCHDHKYDPVSQKEYFQFRAFFEPLGLRQDWVKGEPDPGPFQPYEYSTLRKVVTNGVVRVLDENPEAKTYFYLRGDERSLPDGKPTLEPAVPAFLHTEHFRIEPVSLPLAVHYPGVKPFIREAELGKREMTLTAAKAALAEAEKKVSALRESLAQQPEFHTSRRSPRRSFAKTGEEAHLGYSETRNPHPDFEQSFLMPAPTGLAAAQAKAFAELLQAESALELASIRLATAEAKLAAVQARLAADAARFLGATGDTNQLADAASKAERTAALLAAKQKLSEAETALTLLQAEQTLAAARRQAESADAAKEKKAKTDEEAAVKKAADQIANLKKAVETSAAALQTNGAAYTPFSPVYPTQSTGRRRALAQWIISRDNPLTARVAVNHLWARHFHAPLVPTVFDFGRNGAAPTHPELLDWLAVEFMDSGWSMKHLHRLIVTCSAYRRSSAASDLHGQVALTGVPTTTESGGPGGLARRRENGPVALTHVPAFSTSRLRDGLANMPNHSHTRSAAIDPENRYLWRMNLGQMEAEVVRDSLLHVADNLDLALCGPVLPNTDADKSRRRSLYFECFPEAGGHDPFTGLFDPPDPGECYRRTKTVVPQQALALTNSKFSMQESRSLARRLSEQLAASRDEEFVIAACEQILSRPPSNEELAACRQFLNKQTALLANPPLVESPPSKPANETASLDPQMRARSSLVHALLNHNDFITIR